MAILDRFGIEDLGCAVAIDGVLERRGTEVARQRHRNPPREHLPGGLVHDRAQQHRAARHRDVRDVRRPHLMRAIDRADPHAPHQRSHAITAARRLRRAAGHAACDCSPTAFEMQRVQATHHRKIFPSDRAPHVVHRGPREPQQRGLARDRQIVLAMDHWLPIEPRGCPSDAGCPILRVAL